MDARFLAIAVYLCAAVGTAAGAGTGCQRRLKKVCPGWDTTDTVAQCLACVDAKIRRLQPNCTQKIAEKKCRLPRPAPSPPPPQPNPPPSPPTPPAHGAPQPHLVVFVTDDQGWANVGYHNPGHVITPNSDALARHQGIRLERHYSFRWCAPSRSALMTGRLPYHVLETTNYVTRGMTMLPRKLQQVGYTTHMLGKWHLGDTMEWMLPTSRGFNSSLGYLAGGEDHYTQLQSGEAGCPGVDFWRDDGPAYGQNGTYAAYTYSAAAVRLVQNHPDPQHNPLFLYVATQTMHAPQEVPSFWSDKYPAPTYSPDYAIMNGMATVSDSVLGNLTDALKARGMWENTLLLHVSDNGGPAGRLSSGHSGNNWPLRGGKTNNFEGGVRIAAFLSGGFVPADRRGLALDGYIHLADWYPTLSALAGAAPHDLPPAPGGNASNMTVPPVDGVDLWPYLTGAAPQSPRTEIMISSEDNGAIIAGDMKLILGLQTYGFWQGPVYPNATTDHASETEFDCGAGCLFNISEDPSEYHDLAAARPAELQAMQALWRQRNATAFRPERVPLDPAKCAAARDARGGYLGPYLTF